MIAKPIRCRHAKAQTLLLAGIVGLAAVSTASALRATTLERTSLDQLAQAAGMIVRARCITTSSLWENGSIWTFSEFGLVERFKGSPPQRIRVRVPGGRVGHISMRVEAAPQFRPGDDAVLFLEAAADGSYGVTAWAEGTFRVRQASASSGQAFVTQDSGALAVFDPATHRFRSEGTHNLPWEEFRRQLVNALSHTSAGGLR
jgi:hypothetical protein